MPPFLELTGVYRRFPAGDEEIAVLKDINLRIEAGEMVAIIGASGSGKSTLMNILGCLDQPSAGSYRIDGQETGALDSSELARLRRENFGFIFQRYHLLTHLDAEGNVEMPAVYLSQPKTRRRERARELLVRLGLGDRRSHRPGQLSGGQQQRVSIARALMNGGDVILADEPTGALDSKSGAEMLAILHELHGQGHTIILVTHDAQVAGHAQRIIELRDGEVVSDRIVRPSAASVVRQRSARPPEHLLLAAWDRFAEALGMAVKAMDAHRMRTLLTMLGIIIGITSVVSVVALGQGARQKVIADISAMGTNIIDIMPGADWGDRRASKIHTLSPSDLAALRAQVYVDTVTPIVSGSVTMRLDNVTVSVTVRGVAHEYFRVRGLDFAEGAPFTAEDEDALSQVAVIDHNTRVKLFAEHEDPVGRVIMLGSLPCTIVGVTAEKEGPFGANENLFVSIPYTSAMGRLLGRDYFNTITVRVAEGVSNQLAQQSILKLLIERHGTKDFYTSSSDSILQTVKKTTATMTLLISAIAVISLVVGGIGVMNIMLVSVTERTHEIGIRMAVGARQGDIMQQFLIEAVLVCLIGGMFGIVLSFGTGFVFSMFVSAISMQFSVWSIVVAVACSSLIGVIFGFLPARGAARLNPIEALARE